MELIKPESVLINITNREVMYSLVKGIYSLRSSVIFAVGTMSITSFLQSYSFVFTKLTTMYGASDNNTICSHKVTLYAIFFLLKTKLYHQHMALTVNNSGIEMA